MHLSKVLLFFVLFFFPLGVITFIIVTAGRHLKLSMYFMSTELEIAQPSSSDLLNRCLFYTQRLTEHIKYYFESLNTEVHCKCKLKYLRPGLLFM